MKLKKNDVYIVRLKQGTRDVLVDPDIMGGMMLSRRVSDGIMENSQRMRSYLRDAFMASGSASNPETSRYHSEIFSIYGQHNQDICNMLSYHGLHARTLEWCNDYVSYSKGAERIANFLTLIDATNSMLRFKDIRIVQDMRDLANCLVNCETTSPNKTIDVVSKQIENTRLIKAKVDLHTLPERLQEIVEPQLQYSETSLKGSEEMVPSGAISKLGISHQVRKIDEFAEKLHKEAV